MSIECDIACLRAPCDVGDSIGVAQLIDRAKMAADQIEELIKQVETLREFVADAVQWSEAYPEHIFTSPTPEQVDAVCKTLGFRIDRISAMVLREFTGRWSEKARTILADTEPNDPEDLTCDTCGRVEHPPYATGDKCFEACGGHFVPIATEPKP